MLQEQEQDVVKSDDIFYIGRDLMFLVYKFISNKNKITKEFRKALIKKSISTNQGFFISLQNFSYDATLKHTPLQMPKEINEKIGDFMKS